MRSYRMHLGCKSQTYVQCIVHPEYNNFSVCVCVCMRVDFVVYDRIYKVHSRTISRGLYTMHKIGHSHNFGFSIFTLTHFPVVQIFLFYSPNILWVSVCVCRAIYVERMVAMMMMIKSFSVQFVIEC